ncbi:MAG: tripartite tricarboxylate transporter substrate binding protein [Caldimonas sp.]
MLQRRTLLFAPCLLLGAAARAQSGTAGNYPEKPVTVLAPFAPGGTVDIVARLLAKNMSEDLHQTFLIENRGGAGGTIATAILAHATPDGYTLMVQHMGLAFNAGLYDNLSFDTARDVLPVANIGTTPNVLVVTNSLPVKTVAEFLAYAKKNPKRINYGSGGVGSAGHVSMEVLQASTGVQLTHVPYKGSGPAIIDLISGQIQAMLLTIPAVMSFIRSGKVRAIATSGRERSPALPNLPTIGESGVKNFEYAPWYGLFAPRDTPVAVVDLLHDEVNKVLAMPDIVTQLGQQGLEVHAMSRAQFAGIVSHDIVAWSRTIKKLGLRGE